MTMIFMQIMGKYFRLKRKQLLHMRRRTPGIRKPTCLYHWLMLTLTRSVSREEPGKTRDTRDSLAVGGHVTRYTWQSDNKVSIWHLKIDHVGKIHNYFCQIIICNLGTRMSNGDLKSSHVTRVDWSRVCKSKCWWDTRQSNNPAYWPGRPRAPLSLRRDCIVLWAPAANTHW